ncbi:MAG: hypothetical protein NTY35_06400 [Planctomycetota bacterium]|nr:hypothetical protein [Planctomycetota bacterium]
MNVPCRDFRLLLESRLAGRATPERLAELSWHEHLFACAECRALLEAEEALESLLASLPEPRLAPEVRERVLARLRRSRIHEQHEERLDRLLDVAASEAPPPGLARGVLQGLARRVGDERLDRLLELDVIEAPAGLSARALSGLRLARRAPARRRTALRIVLVGAAAAALVALVWIARPEASKSTVDRVDVVKEPNPAPKVAPDSAPRERAATDTRVASNGSAVPDEVLAALDLLENWDVLVASDAETLQTALPTADEALLSEFEEEG